MRTLYLHGKCAIAAAHQRSLDGDDMAVGYLSALAGNRFDRVVIWDVEIRSRAEMAAYVDYVNSRLATLI